MTTTPALTVILATDRFDTIRKVVDHLRRQTVRHLIELIILAPDRATLELDPAAVDGFAAVQVLEVGSVERFAPARAAGVRAASAPVVVIGETHTYPHPDWAEALIAAHTGPWGLVAPGFGNANPEGALSWAIFLLDYGRWIAGQPAFETDLGPIHNGAYKRDVLLELGPRLETALAHGDELTLHFHSRGHRSYFEPAARIDHLNVVRAVPWLRERFLGGRLIGAQRSTRWSWPRRLLYAAAAPLIPVVILRRLWPGIARARRVHRLPPATLPAIMAGAAVAAVGEAVGYLGGVNRGAELEMNEYELHKVRYA
ncbi:MAG TPA: glycosyltransferase family A protein [Gemmatimonadales bacterium]|nr:glycosyltransferase family A protein [Gemmatimonadales bacterium]